MFGNPKQAMDSNTCSYNPYFNHSNFKVSLKPSVFVTGFN